MFSPKRTKYRGSVATAHNLTRRGCNSKEIPGKGRRPWLNSTHFQGNTHFWPWPADNIPVGRSYFHKITTCLRHKSLIDNDENMLLKSLPRSMTMKLPKDVEARTFEDRSCTHWFLPLLLHPCLSQKEKRSTTCWYSCFDEIHVFFFVSITVSFTKIFFFIASILFMSNNFSLMVTKYKSYFIVSLIL